MEKVLTQKLEDLVGHLRFTGKTTEAHAVEALHRFMLRELLDTLEDLDRELDLN